MNAKPLSPRELRIWYAFLSMGEDVLERVGGDIARATGLSGPEFGVLSRLAGYGKGEMRQQELATVMGWEKSRLSHQLSRMEKRKLVERLSGDGRSTIIALTKIGREKLEAALPIRAESVRRNLLSRLTAEQVEMIIRVSNLLDDED
ncbi:MAG TPA: MarR family transcriptional regulator [Edaphobacter sp.]|jgi:DNA-binding MarR family transcriptional regulator|nr:MarR family transcriptional regulator [Edaphobacter sp.]